jgi:hypothetical protein
LEGRLSKRPDGGRLARIRKAPLKLAGFFSDCQENSRATMSAKSADEHRARARHVRQLAQTMTSPEERQTLFDIAESYERLAQIVDKCALPSGVVLAKF